MEIVNHQIVIIIVNLSLINMWLLFNKKVGIKFSNYDASLLYMCECMYSTDSVYIFTGCTWFNKSNAKSKPNGKTVYLYNHWENSGNFIKTESISVDFMFTKLFIR